jgi:hypothetical protein
MSWAWCLLDEAGSGQSRGENRRIDSMNERPLISPKIFYVSDLHAVPPNGRGRTWCMSAI